MIEKKKKPASLKKKLEAAKAAEAWAGAGPEAFNLAKDSEKAKIDKAPLPPATAKNIAITIRGAMKMFFDGDVSPEVARILQGAGLDMTNLRKSIVEHTVSRALPGIINSGDFERLAKLGAFAGEPVDPVAAGLPGPSVRYITPDEAAAVKNHIDAVIGGQGPQTEPKK